MAVFIKERDKSRKLKLSKKYERECDAQFLFVNNYYAFIVFPVGSAAPRTDYGSLFCLYCLFLVIYGLMSYTILIIFSRQR